MHVNAREIEAREIHVRPVNLKPSLSLSSSPVALLSLKNLQYEGCLENIMSTKFDEKFAVDTHIANMSATATQSTVSPGGPKASKFAAKSGFVIPKNKLSGSLVPVFRGKKSGSNDTTTEENTNKVPRKTKWGPDLTQDASVRRGRALAYQTRVDQIMLLLKSGILEVEDDEESQLAAQDADHKSFNPQLDSEKLEILELEKREAIGEILKLNPSYKIPPDYKPLLKEAIVPIPVRQYQGYNFLGLIFGPASDTQKRLEKETGTIIHFKGTKADTGEKVEISPSDGNVQSTYEELYIHISADTYEKVDAAADLIELLVTSVSGNLAALSTSTSVSGENVNVFSQSQDEVTPLMVSSAGLNQGAAQQSVVGLMQTPPQGRFQYQSPWFPSGPPQTPMRPLNSLAPILTNPVSVQLSSQNLSNMPSLFGPRPPTAAGFNPTIQNPNIVPYSSHMPMQVHQHPYMPQIHPSSHTGPPRNFPMPAPQPSPGQPNISVQFPFTGSQLQPTGPLPIGRPRPLPDRSLTPAGNSAGWSGAPVSAQASFGFSNMGQSAPTMVSPLGQLPVLPQPAAVSTAPPPNVSSAAGPIYASGPSQVGPSSAFHASLRPMQVPASGPTLLPMATSSVSSSSNSRSTVNFSTINPPTATAPRPQHPSSVDFTFQPHRPQNPVSVAVPMPNGQPATQNTPPTRPMAQLPAPQAPSFRLAGSNAAPQPVMQGFHRTQVGNQMGQSQANIASAPFARNPNTGFANLSPISHATPVSPMGPRNFGPGPQVPNLAGPFPPRPGNPLQLRQNYPPPPNRPENHMALNRQFSNKSFMFDKMAPGPRGLQIYDPFSPTSVPIQPQQQGANPTSAKQENDPEYEDLMASVGVK
ncbi:hypothetical protein LWI29_029962 [Acer saccharum]|uniref:KHDC4/BBP-like KH-domain type I domain-containing protein n=1 Tax=Acer saccharum TaxID=4024 RepID=A0AA39TF87_ACESA|nr:hypothetical protein LWI29_029962 [Acer saccharum]